MLNGWYLSTKNDTQWPLVLDKFCLFRIKFLQKMAPNGNICQHSIWIPTHVHLKQIWNYFKSRKQALNPFLKTKKSMFNIYLIFHKTFTHMQDCMKHHQNHLILSLNTQQTIKIFTIVYFIISKVCHTLQEEGIVPIHPVYTTE